MPRLAPSVLMMRVLLSCLLLAMSGIMAFQALPEELPLPMLESASPGPAIAGGLACLEGRLMADGSLFGEAEALALPAQSRPEASITLAIGIVGSSLEAGIYDQAFLMNPGHSMSTVTALKAANERGIPIWSIGPVQCRCARPHATDEDDLRTMRNAVNAGLRVTKPERDITVDNFTGLGYVLEDTRTGAAAFVISGGRNGEKAPAGGKYLPPTASSGKADSQSDEKRNSSEPA